MFLNPSDRDYLSKLDNLNRALLQANNVLNPVFQSFGGAWRVPDMRYAGARAPNQYAQESVSVEFNSPGNLGSPPLTGGAGFGYTMTFAGWAPDGSGGFPVQLNFGDGLSYRRAASAAVWSSWKRVSSYDDLVAPFQGAITSKNGYLNNAVGGDQLIQTSSNGGANAVGLWAAGGGSTTLYSTGTLGIVTNVQVVPAAVGQVPSGGSYAATFNSSVSQFYSRLTVNNLISANGQSELLRLVDDQACISFFRPGEAIRTAYIQSVAGGSLNIMPEANSYMRLGSNGSFAAEIDLSGNFRPVVDGVKYNGVAALRWAAMYSATGAIQTSDERKKTPVSALTPAMRAAAREMLPLIGTYQWLDSVKEKGADKARLHVGFTVQQAIAILERHGIDPFSMAFICHDQWDAEYESRCINAGEKVTKLRIVQKQKTRTVKQPQDVIELINGKPVLVRKIVEVAELVFEEMPVLHEDGSPVMLDENMPMLHRVPVFETVQEPYEAEAKPKYEKVLIREAGDCFAFRYDQLTLFMLSALAE